MIPSRAPAGGSGQVYCQVVCIDALQKCGAAQRAYSGLFQGVTFGYSWLGIVNVGR